MIIVALQKDIKALIRATHNALPVLLVVLRVPKLLLFRLSVGWIWIVDFATEVFGGWCAIVYPCRTADKVCDAGAGKLGHLRHDLDPGRAVADYGDAFVGVVKIVVPAGGVGYVAFEIF